MKTFDFKSQPREGLTPRKPYLVDGLCFEERLCSHRGEYEGLTPPAGFPPKAYLAQSEAVYEWVLVGKLHGRPRTLRYSLPESESTLLGKSTTEIHEVMMARFAEQLRIDVST